jgi:hypothetical protein
MTRFSRSAAVAGATLALLSAVASASGVARSAERERAEDVAAPNVTTLQLPAGRQVRDALALDVDGDGSCDLVLADSNDAEPIVRTLALYLQRKDGAAFVAQPDASLALTPDVVAYAVADVHADPGAEIVLFGAQGAFAWRWRAQENERFVKLLDCEFLWQMADPQEAFHWQAGIVDLDRDGLPDLALPYPGGWRLAFQRRKDGVARFDTTFDLDVPEGARAVGSGLGSHKKTVVRSPGGRRTFSVSLEGGGLDMETERVTGGPLVHVSESVPAAQFIDWDADGDLDMLCMSATEVSVFVQDPVGRFSEERVLELENPVVADRDRELDVSYGVHVLDLDGDRRADCVIFAGDKRSKDIRTQALIFVHAPVLDESRAAGTDPLFGLEGIPTQMLVFGGFARALGFKDIDGDGLADLVVGAIQPDLIDELRTASTERIEAELYAYRNTGHGFAKRPDLTRKLSLPASNSEFSVDFVGDITGDGMSEMLVREESDRLRLYLTRRTRDGWTLVDRPLWELRVEPSGELLLPESGSSAPRLIFVLEANHVRCVSLL